MLVSLACASHDALPPVTGASAEATAGKRAAQYGDEAAAVEMEPAAAPETSFLHTARSLQLDAPADFATNVDVYLYGALADAAA